MVCTGGTGRRRVGGGGGDGGRGRWSLGGGSASALNVRPTAVVRRWQHERRPLAAGRRLAGQDRRAGEAWCNAGRRGAVHLAYEAGRPEPAQSSRRCRAIRLATDFGVY